MKKFETEMTLFDNPKNRRKAECLGALDIMLDDSDNPDFPEEWYNFWNNDPNEVGSMPWGAKVRLTLEVIE